jgi:ribose transport system permease protein
MELMPKLRSWVGKPSARALAALALMLFTGLVFNADGAFLKPGTHADMLRHISRHAILACGMTLVIVAGGIDLSVGSVLGLSAVCFALLTMQLQLPAAVAIAACMAVGCCCGVVSGMLIGRFRIQPFIATLAMMVLTRGLAKALTGGKKVATAVQLPDGTYQYVTPPPVFEWLSGGIGGGRLAVVTVVLALSAAICWVVLAKLRWGRYIYAVGGNEEAARLSGVPVLAVKLLAYGACGLFSAVAGICQAAEEMQGDPEAGQTYELTAIAIVVIGGTSLAGGRGGMLLTLIGALTIGYLEKILSLNAVGDASRLMLTGAIVVLAVLFQKGGQNGPR